MFDLASLPSAISSVHPQIRFRLRRHAEIFSKLDSYLRFLTKRHFLDCREYIEHHLPRWVRFSMRPSRFRRAAKLLKCRRLATAQCNGTMKGLGEASCI